MIQWMISLETETEENVKSLFEKFGEFKNVTMDIIQDVEQEQQPKKKIVRRKRRTPAQIAAESLPQPQAQVQ